MSTKLKYLLPLALLGASSSTFAQQQAWPNHPLRMIVVAPGGSSLDAIARPLGEKMKDLLGQPVVIENRPAAGGTQGTDAIAKAAPDGYTMGISYNGPLAFAPFLYGKLPYDPLRDLAPVAITTSQPNLLAAAANVPVNTIKELVPYLRGKPGQLNYASVGNGSSSHLTMELFKSLTGTYVVHVPYNGGPPAMISVAAGDTQFLFTVPTVIMPQVKAGKMRAIAVTSSKRYALLPEVPTVAESGIKELAGFESMAWNGVLVPAATPRDLVMRLNHAINAAFNDPQVRQQLAAAGLEPVGGPPEAFGKLIADEAKKWGPIIKRTGARLD
jgi:tripartite-type tricarboxylate transporter receptor subunit TctC